MKPCSSLLSYACLSALMLLAPAHGWTTNPSASSAASNENLATKKPNNRMKDWHKAAAAAAVSAVLVASPMVANAAASSANFAGSYSDPFHPNCQRVIVKDDDKAATTLAIRGTDGNPGCPADGSGTPWTLTGQVGSDGSSILVDFTPKGGPPNLKGTWDGSGIMWPDGNKWTKTSS
jgi:hypothetical protein